MPKDHSVDLSAAASRAVCPYCEHHGLEFTLRCDLGYGPCLFTARCDQCSASLEIVVSESELDPAALSSSVGPCSGCGDARRVATLSCSEKTQACVYHVECRACGRKSSA